jgi:hypothetical protein
MFAGFNREVRNSMRLLGLRLRYAVAVCEIAVEQYGAAVAANIDLLLTPRGTGVVRTAGTFRAGTLQSSGGALASTTNTLLVTTSDGNIVNLDASSVAVRWYRDLSLLKASAVIRADDGAAANARLTVRGGNLGSGQDGIPSLTLLGGNASPNATTNIRGGNVTISSGAGSSGSAGAAHGGNVLIGAGAGFGTGGRGVVQLGFDGTNVCRVTVRNTIFGLNGYTSSAAAATTTELPTSGDFGIHKNTTSGDVHLCFNDAGTIRSVLMT